MTAPTAHTQNPARIKVLGHPRGIFLVSATEAWERFSYYGMVGLLVLFLTSSPSGDGFGWENADAVKLYGVYSGLVFASPAIGGWISSRYWGERRSIRVGGLLIVAGHFLMAGPVIWPTLIELASGYPVSEIISRSDIAITGFAPNLQTIEVLSAQADFLLGPSESEAARGAILLAYTLKGGSVLIGLALIVIGTGFIKATISSIVDKLYDKGDPKRDAGFTLFMVGIWFGALSANFVAGTLGETLGWHFGLSAAGIGMAIGMAVYLAFEKKWLGEVGVLPDRVSAGGQRSFTKIERDRLLAIGIMCIFTVLYAVSFYQKGGVLNLMIKESAGRTIGGFEVPATWFLSISTVCFIVFAPLVSGWMSSAKTRGDFVPDVVQKLAFGLALLACGYGFMMCAAHEVGQERSPSGLWFVAGYVFFGLAEIFIWPPQLAAATKLAPARMQSFIVGCWFIATGVGTFLTGYVGAFGYSIGMLRLFALIFAACILGAVVLVLLRSTVKKLMHENEQD